MLASDVRNVGEALCPGRCATGWEALAVLRRHESESEGLAARRRAEHEAQLPRGSSLSELLLLRWRAGDWAVAPEQLLAQIQRD
jgi:hypothetical protein